MLADRGALEFDLTAHYLHADQTEIGRASADVADQHEVAVVQISLERPPARYDPGVKGRQRLFEQSQFLETGVARSFDGQFSRLLVEGRWHGQNYVLPLESQYIIFRGHRVIPAVTQMGEVARRGFDGRTGLLRMIGAPRQNPRRPINRVVAEPGLGRRDLPSGDERALFAGKYANNSLRALFPRKPQTAGGVLLVRKI